MHFTRSQKETICNYNDKVETQYIFHEDVHVNVNKYVQF